MVIAGGYLVQSLAIVAVQRTRAHLVRPDAVFGGLHDHGRAVIREMGLGEEQLLGLAGYLGARANITREVAEELQFNSTRDPYRGLQTLARLRWPSDDHVLDLSLPLFSWRSRRSCAAYGNPAITTGSTSARSQLFS